MKKNLAETKFKRVLRKLNSRQGWAILVVTVFIMIITTSAVIGPAVRTTAHLQNIVLDVAISRSEDMILATSSPIRNKIVKEVYNRVQQQLVEHLRKAQSGQPYVCQGVLTPPASMGTSSGNLASQFGLCEPEKVFEGLDGATNKTIDFLSAYPEHNTPLTDPSLEEARKSIIYQLQNSYEYTLRTIYIGQKVMPRGRFGNEREERYQWSVRADVAMKTNEGDITRGLVIYYDVTLTNNFYINGINGAGNACDFQQTKTVPCPGDNPNNPNKFGSSCVIVVVQNNDTGAAGTLADFDPMDFPDGLPDGLKVVNECIQGFSNSVSCPAENDQTIRLIRLKSTRPQVGCASANTGRQGVSGLDPAGYVFYLTARITHIGSTYN